MAAEIPVAELHAGFSSPGGNPTAWAEGRRHIEGAEVFWLSTVRPDGRPHVTPLLAVWHDDAMYFCTGPAERKAKEPKAEPTVHSHYGRPRRHPVEGVRRRSEIRSAQAQALTLRRWACEQGR